MVKAREFNSMKVKLVKKAQAAILSSVQLYNNPQVTFKTGAFNKIMILTVGPL